MGARLMGEREIRPAGRYEWEAILRRTRATGLVGGSDRIGSNGKATKGAISASLFKAIALTFASYANTDGSSVRPGDATVAVDVECSIKTVKTVRTTLLRLGLIERAGGRRAGGGEEYRLTIPSDLLDRVEVLSPGQHLLAARSIREAARGTRGGSAGPPTPPVDNPAMVGPPDHPNGPNGANLGGSAGPTENSYGGSAGPASGGPPDPRTDQDRPHKSTDQPDADLRTDLTVMRAPETEPKTQIPGKTKCPQHGLAGGTRDDGLPACPLCRADVPGRARDVAARRWPKPDNVVEFRPREPELRSCRVCFAPTTDRDNHCPPEAADAR